MSGSGQSSLRPSLKTGGAFSLVEVTIALAVAGFCLIAMLGLLQTGLGSEKATVGQTIATGIVTDVYSDLLAAAAGEAKTRHFGIVLTNQSATTPQTIYVSRGGRPTGSAGAGPAADSLYRVTVGVQSSTNAATPTRARILVTWPAAADPNPSEWPVKHSGALEVLTALDRP